MLQAIDFKHALGQKDIGVLDIGAGTGLLSLMAARYALLQDHHNSTPMYCRMSEEMGVACDGVVTILLQIRCVGSQNAVYNFKAYL